MQWHSLVRTLMLVPAVWLAACDSSPVYEGRTLSAWMRDLDSRHDFQRRRACDVISRIGPPAAEAIPRLLELLEDDTSGVQDVAETALGQMGPAALPHLEPLLQHIDPAIKLHAAIAIVGIDGEHPAARDQLIRALIAVGYPELARRARRRVVSLGAGIIPALILLFDDDYGPVRMQLLGTIKDMRHAAKSAIPRLVELGRVEPKPEVRKEIIRTIARLGPREEVESSVRTFANDPDETVAATVNAALGTIGAIEAPTAAYAEPGSVQPMPTEGSSPRKPLRSLLSTTREETSTDH